MTTSRNVDLELGELAIAMETRVHGSVSMEPVTRAKNRDPLDHRSLGKRLARVSPADSMLRFDARCPGRRPAGTPGLGWPLSQRALCS